MPELRAARKLAHVPCGLAAAPEPVPWLLARRGDALAATELSYGSCHRPLGARKVDSAIDSGSRPLVLDGIANSCHPGARYAEVLLSK
jgi:hypothetical protein